MVQLPNILWIVATQWRAQALGFAGDINARTPCLDQLALESVNYSQAVTPHPFGPFARAAMLTGRLAPENGVIDYFDSLPVGAGTIARDLAERGYETAFFGKWHLAPRDRHVPLVGDEHAKQFVPPEYRGGFHFWEGFESGFLLNDPWLHGSRLPVPQQFPGYQSDVLCERAGEYIAAKAALKLKRSLNADDGRNDSPWFAVVSLESPHPPYNAGSAGIVPAAPQSISLRRNVPRGDGIEEKARRELAGYYAHIEATDRAIGRLLSAVRKENTLVVFTSVHGDMHGAHGLFRKGWPYEESVRVPLLVRPPGHGIIPRVDQNPVSLVDLPRLTVSWAEGAAVAQDRHCSLISMPSVVELPHQCDRAWGGVRTSTRKLILTADGEPWLFFDLERDPFEQENLINEPARATELAALRDLLRVPIKPKRFS